MAKYKDKNSKMKSAYSTKDLSVGKVAINETLERHEKVKANSLKVSKKELTDDSHQLKSQSEKVKSTAKPRIRKMIKKVNDSLFADSKKMKINPDGKKDKVKVENDAKQKSGLPKFSQRLQSMTQFENLDRPMQIKVMKVLQAISKLVKEIETKLSDTLSSFKDNLPNRAEKNNANSTKDALSADNINDKKFKLADGLNAGLQGINLAKVFEIKDNEISKTKNIKNNFTENVINSNAIKSQGQSR